MEAQENETKDRGAKAMRRHYDAAYPEAVDVSSIAEGGDYYHLCERTGCWIWLGGIDKNGQPSKINARMDDGRVIRARPMRCLYEYDHGQQEPGVWVSPQCGNPMCVRPKHAKATTPAQRVEAARKLRNEWLMRTDPDLTEEAAWENS